MPAGGNWAPAEYKRRVEQEARTSVAMGRPPEPQKWPLAPCGGWCVIEAHHKQDASDKFRLAFPGESIREIEEIKAA